MRFLNRRFEQKTKHLDISQLKEGANRTVTRKLLLKFISVFHPDKQNTASEVSDRFRHIDILKVAEEITKYLNLHLGKI